MICFLADFAVYQNKTGYMQADLMLEYMRWFKKTINKDGIVIYFLDRHKTHMTLELGKFCRENGIVLIALYPNSTRITQPLDVGLFGGLKTKFKAEVESWSREHPSESFDIIDLAPLIKKANDAVATPEVIRKSFEKCGIYPWNADKIDYGRCLGQNFPIKEPNIEVLSDIVLIAANNVKNFDQIAGEEENIEEESEAFDEVAQNDSGFGIDSDMSNPSEQSQHHRIETDHNTSSVLSIMQEMLRENEKQRLLIQQFIDQSKSEESSRFVLKVPEAPKRTGTRTILKLPHVVTSSGYIDGMENVQGKKQEDENRKKNNKLQREEKVKIKQEATEEKQRDKLKRAAEKTSKNPDPQEPPKKRGRGRPPKVPKT